MQEKCRAANPNVFRIIYGTLGENGIIIGIVVLMWKGTISKDSF
jgi:hypothetical protein